MGFAGKVFIIIEESAKCLLSYYHYASLSIITFQLKLLTILWIKLNAAKGTQNPAFLSSSARNEQIKHEVG